jgi:hypothetical protein
LDNWANVGAIHWISEHQRGRFGGGNL